MNAAIRAAVLTAHGAGVECVGIRRGYNGLIAGDTTPLTPERVEGIITQGGTMLYTARSPEFMTKRGQKRAAENVRFMGVDALVIIGGDGTFRGARILADMGVAVACIPGTIDNDIGSTSYTIGFDTACNTAVEAMDKLNDTMKSHERCSVLEVMGHKTGYIAVNVAISTSATATLIPEFPIDLRRDVIEPIREARLRGDTHFTVIVAEGAYSASEVAKCIREETGIETRVTTLGHIQRGGIPLVRDRVTATRMGSMAARLLIEGERNKVVVMGGECGDCCESVELDAALAMKKTLDSDMRRMLRLPDDGGRTATV
jgi:6-phosphofructokinase 1